MKRRAILAIPAWLLAISVVSLTVITSASALPVARGYEMVSPAYKGGFGATVIEAAADDGESLVFYSPGSFDGAPAGFAGLSDSLPYIARRTNGGWSTSAFMPPDTLLPYVGSRDATPDLTTTIAVGKPGSNIEEAEQDGTQAEFFSHQADEPDIAWTLLAEPIETLAKDTITPFYYTASADLCHIIFESVGIHLVGVGELLPAAKGAGQQLYELMTGCKDATTLKLISLKNNGSIISPKCNAEIGQKNFNSGKSSAFNAVSRDGSEIFFTTCIEGPDENFDHQIFVRLGGAKTIELSKSLGSCSEVPCVGASTRQSTDFVGASEDGSFAYFTTAAPLTGGDVGENLYLATIGCKESEPGCPAEQREVTSLKDVSTPPKVGEPGNVLGTIKMAPDGLRVYFVASGVLLSQASVEALTGEGREAPLAGAANLYVYDAETEQTQFIADLCSGYDRSGTQADSRCPSGSDEELWAGGVVRAQTAGPDGRFLAFTTYAQLHEGDDDTTTDVYRYDAATGSLVRISTGEEGYGADGNSDEFGAAIKQSHRGGRVVEQHEMDDRAISEDGSRILFTTVQPLSPAAIDRLINVYEWHETGEGEGRVTLVSGGTSTTSTEDAVMSPSGRDVFFVTTLGLAQQDTDGAPDVYDARLGGGFPPSAAEPESCEGDGCQGPLTNPVPLSIPATEFQTNGENVTSLPVAKKPAVKVKSGKRKGKRAKRAQKARGNGHARKGKRG